MNLKPAVLERRVAQFLEGLEDSAAVVKLDETFLRVIRTRLNTFDLALLGADAAELGVVYRLARLGVPKNDAERTLVRVGTAGAASLLRTGKRVVDVDGSAGDGDALKAVLGLLSGADVVEGDKDHASVADQIKKRLDFAKVVELFAELGH